MSKPPSRSTVLARSSLRLSRTRTDSRAHQRSHRRQPAVRGKQRSAGPHRYRCRSGAGRPRNAGQCDQSWWSRHRLDGRNNSRVMHPRHPRGASRHRRGRREPRRFSSLRPGRMDQRADSFQQRRLQGRLTNRRWSTGVPQVDRRLGQATGPLPKDVFVEDARGFRVPVTGRAARPLVGTRPRSAVHLPELDGIRTSLDPRLVRRSWNGPPIRGAVRRVHYLCGAANDAFRAWDAVARSANGNKAGGTGHLLPDPRFYASCGLRSSTRRQQASTRSCWPGPFPTDNGPELSEALANQAKAGV